MKTNKQDIQDLLSQLAADIEEIKAVLSSGAAGNTNAISNGVAIGNGSAAANADQIIAEVKWLLEPIAGICNKLPDRIKSYHSQLLLHVVRDLREELPTIENKIDNSLTMLVSIYDRLNQLEDAMMPDTPQQGQIGRIQSANGKSAKSGIISVIKSAWSGVCRFLSTRPARWYCNPYILCAIVIYLLYFGLSIFSWQQWQCYRDENARLRLTADKYRVDSIILCELYPQAAITLSAYEHITESEGADAAIEVFREDINTANSKSQ